MKNKLLICVIIPENDEKFDVYIPVNKKIGNIIVLLNKALKDLTNGQYSGDEKTALYNRQTGEKYAVNTLVRETSIKNGTKLILM